MYALFYSRGFQLCITGCVLHVWQRRILCFLIKLARNEACWTCDLQSGTERHQNSSGTKEVWRGWTNRSFKSPFLVADESVEQSCTERYRGPLGSHHWLEWGRKVHLQGAFAVMTNVTRSCNLNVRRGPVWSLVILRMLMRLEKEYILSFINSGPVREEVWALWKGLLRSMGWWAYVHCLRLLEAGISSCVKRNICHCDDSWHILVLWLLEGARIWKGASLISRSQNPAVSCPLCKLSVNEWAGHLTPWGSTSGSSDHQLLCLGLSHAPVSMMNPEHECKALTPPYVPSSSLLASKI